MTNKHVVLAFCLVLALGAFAGCQSGASSSSASTAASTSASSAASSASASNAASSASASAEAVSTPLPENGRYTVEVESSSSMFRPVECVLDVTDDGITATMTLSGDGYEKLFLGKIPEAEASTEADWYMWSDEDEDGRYTYVFPVEALDTDIDCAAFSFRKQTWYDRVLVFKSETLQPVSE